MKTKIISLFSMFLFVACTKEQVSSEETILIDKTKPILIQVEAIHNDGKVVTSPVLVLRF